MVDFVSYLDDVRQRSCAFELGDDVGGIDLDLSRKRVISQGRPNRRYRLATGICPRVRVVEVEKQPGAGGFDALGHAQRVGEVVDLYLGAVGMHEDAKAKSVGAVGAEDGDGIARPGTVPKRAARLLDPLQG